ncbi:hypothetical protein CNEO4_1460081 [Clostridium neonatale]|nr:hypothetical protein CNEO4_1460081 [Clostridium neonatale]CAI3629787.1 hypothetical protein CNEO3_370042 [Clostridium neonatale]CAI3660169.1 hypothetical protein CNEO3_420041 [Clostridium neonatale]CAI3662046.1 hypothetical protein CNEO3_390042 [Clostridium neonatale]
MLKFFYIYDKIIENFQTYIHKNKYLIQKFVTAYAKKANYDLEFVIYYLV